MKVSNRGSRIIYYLTCLISAVVELGSVFWGIKYGFGISGILGLALAYQLGNVFRFFINKKIAHYQDFILGGVVLVSAVLLDIDKTSLIGYLLAFIMFFVFSVFLQNVRSSAQGDIPRWQKRSCRVIGFVLSALMYLLGDILMVVINLVVLISSCLLDKYDYDKWICNLKRGVFGYRICWAMVTHQAHYFVYTYIMFFLVMKYFENPFISTLWFAANWVPYTITEPLVQKLEWNKWYVIAIGAHVFNAIILVGIYFTVDISITFALLLWVLTGFGGGNVFCIKKALAENIKYDKNIWNFSEQLGHILGVIVSIIVVVLNFDLKVSMLVGAGFALVTVPIITYFTKFKKVK